MSEKDTFQILADEITLIRGEIKQLQRSSLNKDEAKAPVSYTHLTLPTSDLV